MSNGLEDTVTHVVMFGAIVIGVGLLMAVIGFISDVI